MFARRADGTVARPPCAPGPGKRGVPAETSSEPRDREETHARDALGVPAERRGAETPAPPRAADVRALRARVRGPRRRQRRVGRMAGEELLVGALALDARPEAPLEGRRDAAQARPVASALARDGAPTLSPSRRQRRTRTCVAPSSSAARKGIAADRPASMKSRPWSATGGPASSGRAADARSARRSDRGSTTERCRSTAEPVSTSVATGCGSTGEARTAAKQAGRELLDEPRDVDDRAAAHEGAAAADELADELGVRPGQDAVAHAAGHEPHGVARPRRGAVGRVERAGQPELVERQRHPARHGAAHPAALDDQRDPGARRSRPGPQDVEDRVAHDGGDGGDGGVTSGP